MRAELFKAVSCFTSWNWFSLSHCSYRIQEETGRRRLAKPSNWLFATKISEKTFWRPVKKWQSPCWIQWQLLPRRCRARRMTSGTSRSRTCFHQYRCCRCSAGPSRSSSTWATTLMSIRSIDWPFHTNNKDVLYRIYDGVSAVEDRQFTDAKTRVHWRWKSIPISVGGATTAMKEKRRREKLVDSSTGCVRLSHTEEFEMRSLISAPFSKRSVFR